MKRSFQSQSCVCSSLSLQAVSLDILELVRNIAKVQTSTNCMIYYRRSQILQILSCGTTMCSTLMAVTRLLSISKYQLVLTLFTT